MLLYYYLCHIYLPNIYHHMMSLMCTELQHIQLLLRCALISALCLSIFNNIFSLCYDLVTTH